jgi:hypothetical protein
MVEIGVCWRSTHAIHMNTLSFTASEISICTRETRFIVPYETLPWIAAPSYGEAGSELWHDYTVCLLFCLNVMLRERFIPLIDKESSLRRLAVRSKNSFAVTGKFLTKVVKRNYLFHESCHYIAHCVNQEGSYHAGQDISSEGEHKVVIAFLGGSFHPRWLRELPGRWRSYSGSAS